MQNQTHHNSLLTSSSSKKQVISKRKSLVPLNYRDMIKRGVVQQTRQRHNLSEVKGH